MRVVTWNVWWRFGDWRRRAAAVARVLAELDADVVCLQETWRTAEADQAEGLARELGLAAATSHDPPDPDRVGFANAVLSRWPIVDTEVVALPGHAGASGVRTALATRIDAPVGPLEVVCTHLDHRFDASAVRAEQVRAVCALVARRRGDPRRAFPPLVCGDLNAVPTSDEIRILTGEAAPPVPGLVFTDAWAVAGAGPGVTWDRRNPHLAGTAWPDRRLDYVLVGWPRPRPLGNPVAATLAGDGPVGGIWPSDHLAVVVDLVDDDLDDDLDGDRRG